MSRKQISLLVCVVTLFSASLFPVDGVVLINQASVMAAGGFPYHITQPGSYKLSGNLVVTDPTKDAIDIDVENVTLDLNGFSITGPEICTGSLFGPITSCMPSGFGGSGIVGANNVSVFNGSVVGFQSQGISLNGVNPVGDRVEHVTATQNGGIGILTQQGTVINCEASHNYGVGISAGSAINDVANFNAFNGISATVAIGNTTKSNGSFGLTVGQSGLASQNVLFSNGQDLQLWPRSPVAISAGNNNCTGQAC